MDQHQLELNKKLRAEYENNRRKLSETEKRYVLDFTRHFLEHPPKTDDELYDYIWLVLGIKIPREVHPSLPEHQAPFTAICDLFFERVSSGLMFANRSGGKTFDSSILDHLNFEFKPGCETTHAGATRDQATRGHFYFTSIYNDNEVLAEGLSSDPTKNEIHHKNKSWYHVITGSKKGLRSGHPNKNIIDEIDEMDWNVLQTGVAMAMSSADGRILGQNIFTSTRQHADGPMNRLLNEADEKNIAVYQWNIFTAVERCERECVGDKDYGDCPAFFRCNGLAHQSNGFYKIQDFIAKVLEHDDHVWRSEWLNEIPSGEVLVYSCWNPQIHEIPPEKEFEIPDDWTIVSAIDFGSSPGHPFVYAKAAISPDGYWFWFWEYYSTQGDLLANHAMHIKASPRYKFGEYCFSDHDAQDRKELEAPPNRIITLTAKKDIRMGIDKVNGLLEVRDGRSKMYFFKSKVPNMIREMKLYAWPQLLDGKPSKEGNPLKLNDHSPDVCRYAVYSWLTGGPPKVWMGYGNI
ncbi:hypothetical protein M0R19_05165 [Candidatus Pacearchaeota archaeon]|jgi:hypothetical protein|nr:hypothetical protein [Candidatus Pacearchaeota archaeon]